MDVFSGHKPGDSLIEGGSLEHPGEIEIEPLRVIIEKD